MNVNQIYFFYLILFLLSAMLTGLVRYYALRKSILDIPNERSSHQVPTPRGGGIAIVLTFLLSLVYLFIINKIDQNLFIALTVGGVVIAIVGYCDDLFTLSARLRIFVHLLAAVWAVYWLHGYPVLNLGGYAIHLHQLGNALAVIGIIWCVNFYNFMDGIDGLAASEGIFIAAASAIILFILGVTNEAIMMFMLAMSIAGFLIWNWPPAKIFMGDVCSGFLGYVFGVTALYTMNNDYLSFGFWWIVLAVFLCDATFTLILRMLQGKKWYSAHREHAYQILTTYGFSHKKVTNSIFAINFFLLLPLAYLSMYKPTLSVILVIAATGFLWISWYKIKRLEI